MRKTLHQVHCTWFGAEVELVKWFAPGSRGLCKLESKVKRLGWPWLLKDPLDGGEGCLVLFLHRTARPQAKLESLGTVCVCVCVLLNHAWLFAISWTVAHQAPLSSGQEYWSGLPFPSPKKFFFNQYFFWSLTVVILLMALTFQKSNWGPFSPNSLYN